MGSEEEDEDFDERPEGELCVSSASLHVADLGGGGRRTCSPTREGSDTPSHLPTQQCKSWQAGNKSQLLLGPFLCDRKGKSGQSGVRVHFKCGQHSALSCLTDLVGMCCFLAVCLRAARGCFLNTTACCPGLSGTPASPPYRSARRGQSLFLASLGQVTLWP